LDLNVAAVLGNSAVIPAMAFILAAALLNFLLGGNNEIVARD